MNRISNFISRIPSLSICGFGALIVLLGELKGAIWDGNKPGGTISEWYKGLPSWVKQVLSGIYIGIFIHLIEWRINDSPTTINANNIEHLTVENSQEIEGK